jgi:diacylglycerol kinase family enzyme
VELTRRATGADVHITATRDQLVLRGWLEERMPGYDTAIVAGGDGSLGIAFNVAAPRNITLGYIPAGFGNATAHLLNLPRDPESLSALLAAGTAEPVDLVRVDGRLALFAGVGWDAVVAGRYARAGAKRLRGWARAVLASTGDLVHRRVVRVEVDGRPAHYGPMELLVAGTTPFYGRGLVVNPGADPRAGRFLLRVYPGPLPALALETARWALHVAPKARPVGGTHATVSALDDLPLPLQADGDAIDERPQWEINIEPKAVRLIGRWRAEGA